MTKPASTLTDTSTAVRAARSGPVGVGLIGVGMISDAYLENLTRFPDVQVVILGNRDADRARGQAEKHHIGGWGGIDDVLAHPDVELVINLTVPAVHAAVSSAALSAGKHVWSEKPIATDRASARALLNQAAASSLLLGVAPDTVLGPGLQSARRAIAAGVIGLPIAAQTTIQYPGPDLFHPSPEFLFATGAGPLYDVGPYYLTALTHLFGPFARVAAVSARARPTRTVRVGERAGTEFAVSVPTHVSAVSEFAGGGVAQSLFSFESPLTKMGLVEITGTEGTMLLPDPNTFGGDILITRAAATMHGLLLEPEWETIPASGVEAGRGIGALDLARAIRTGAAPLASGALAYHVLDTMIAIDEAIATQQSVAVASTIDPIPLLDQAWDPYQSTLAVGEARSEDPHA